LLAGCAFAPTFAYILVDGGFFHNELCIVSLSGVIFLGIGDTAAALYGKAYGRSLWSTQGSKTTEGTWACIFAVSAIYFILLCLHENPLFQELMPVVAFAAFCTAVLEGLTF
jgi:dolichol kinase